MFTVTLDDGTPVEIDGELDPSLPLVILLHGLGGSSSDMTAPLTSYGPIAFNQAATFPLLRDEGLHFTPPPVPFARFYADPPLTSVTSWRDALNAAGFSTATYTQNGSLIGPSAAQLASFMSGPLASHSDLRGLRIAFVAHSRGGVIARSFLVSAARNPALAPHLSRVQALITLHSPNLGTGIASDAVTIDGLAARLQTAIATAGWPPLGLLALLRSVTKNSNLPELAPGSAVLAGIAAGEPVPGIAYHTFGGTSTVALRLWADVYTPDSTIPLPWIPPFHWDSTPVMLGAPLDFASFAAIAFLLPMPFMVELLAVLEALAARTPELADGAGDVLVSDANAHLPFSATRTTNPLNHLEALFDPVLQSQVVAILLRLRDPLFSGRAIASISPFPASSKPAKHVVTATDAVTHKSLSSGTVSVYDPMGLLARQARLGQPFTYGFASQIVTGYNHATGSVTSEREWPYVEVDLGLPYGTVDVDIGHPA